TREFSSMQYLTTRLLNSSNTYFAGTFETGFPRITGETISLAKAEKERREPRHPASGLTLNRNKWRFPEQDTTFQYQLSRPVLNVDSHDVFNEISNTGFFSTPANYSQNHFLQDHSTQDIAEKYTHSFFSSVRNLASRMLKSSQTFITDRHGRSVHNLQLTFGAFHGTFQENSSSNFFSTALNHSLYQSVHHSGPAIPFGSLNVTQLLNFESGPFFTGSRVDMFNKDVSIDTGSMESANHFTILTHEPVKAPEAETRDIKPKRRPVPALPGFEVNRFEARYISHCLILDTGRNNDMGDMGDMGDMRGIKMSGIKNRPTGFKGLQWMASAIPVEQPGKPVTMNNLLENQEPATGSQTVPATISEAFNLIQEKRISALFPPMAHHS
ncbi:MAG: hypothetical protein GY940_01975, partial [bacterium]|nr:hypothetical protein [bacterium]